MDLFCSQQRPQVLASNAMVGELNVDQIKKLWILDLIIQTGSLKAAALQAKVTPSAVSQSLSALEESVGKPLLIRERGSITPTSHALSILEVVRPAFDAFERLKNLGQSPAPRMTWLNFGTYESIAVCILPGLIESLRDKMPHLKLGLRVARTSNLLTMVRKGELCSALVPEPEDLDRFYVKSVGEDRLGLYVSSKHAISKLGYDAVKKYGLGSLAPGKDGLPRYMSNFLKQIDPIKAFVQSDSFETLKSAASQGALVAMLPNRVAKRDPNLLEITPKSFKSLGTHRLVIVSKSSCDPEETEFIANEVERILAFKASLWSV
jgi:DNA-binding transcriptional LysR family regulator